MEGYLQGIVVNRMAFPFLTLFFIQCNTNNPILQPTFNANYHVHNLISKLTIHTDDKCRDFTNLFATEYSKYSIKRPPDNFSELNTSRIPLDGHLLLLLQKNLQVSFKVTILVRRHVCFFDRQTLSIMWMRLLNSFQAEYDKRASKKHKQTNKKNSFFFHLPVSDSVDILTIFPDGRLSFCEIKGLTEMELKLSHTWSRNSYYHLSLIGFRSFYGKYIHFADKSKK